MLEYRYNISQLESISKNIIQNAPHKILCFYAGMGVGKTTLIKEIIKQLGSQDKVSSPTFSLVNEYDAQGEPVYHFDFYRIESIDEAYQIGAENYLDSGYWCLIEWPENIEEILPKQVTNIYIQELDNGDRLLEIK